MDESPTTVKPEDHGPTPVAPSDWIQHVSTELLADWARHHHPTMNDVAQEHVMVPASALVRVPSHQIAGRRFSFPMLSALAISMHHGQLQPVLVIPLDDGRAVIVIGHRRGQAARYLPGDFEVQVARAPVDPQDVSGIIEAAAAENSQREGLSVPELTCAAGTAVQLRDSGKRAKAVTKFSDSVGMSRPYIRNLVRIARKIDPRILDYKAGTGAWMAAPQKLTLPAALSLITHPQEKQWKIWLGESSGGSAATAVADGGQAPEVAGPAGDTPGNGGGAEVSRADLRTIKKLLAGLRERMQSHKPDSPEYACMFWFIAGLLCSMGMEFDDPLSEDMKKTNAQALLEQLAPKKS